MPLGRQLLNFIVEKDLLDRIDDFRFENRFATRAAAIKWLLDWALQQRPNPAPPKLQAPQLASAVAAVSQHQSVTAEPPVSPRNVAGAGHEPSHESVIQALKAQGYEVGETAVQNGQARIVVRSADNSALVTVGMELHELAAGRLTLAQVAARRRST